MRLSDFGSYDEYAAAYSDLVQQYQDGRITLYQFICSEDDLFSEYSQFLVDMDWTESEVTAHLFMSYRDTKGGYAS